jgi:mono/diheme cytochrome c family protein
MPRNLLFENVTCSRCGGSGHYSYCQMYGTTCFKCHGDGKTLTKRGAAAQSWLNAQKRKPGSEVKVGETIMIDGVPGFSPSYWAKVTEINGDCDITAVGLKNGERMALNGWATQEVRVAQSKERLAELRTQALAFQASLTQAGTVRKKAAKAA